MMIKVFTTDKDGKINLTPKELKDLLDEAYWEGYRNNNSNWTYTTPSWKPYTYTWTTNTNNSTIKLSNDAQNSNITSNNEEAYKISSCSSMPINYNANGEEFCNASKSCKKRCE